MGKDQEKHEDKESTKKMAGSSTDHFMPAISRHWRIVSGFVHAVLKARFDEKLVLCRRSRFLNIVKETGKNHFPAKTLFALNDQKVKISATCFLEDFRPHPRPSNWRRGGI